MFMSIDVQLKEEWVVLNLYIFQPMKQELAQVQKSKTKEINTMIHHKLYKKISNA